MGKRLIQQRRGKGTPTYKYPSHRVKAKARYIRKAGKGIIKDLIYTKPYSTPLVLIQFEDGTTFYNLAPEGVKIGDVIEVKTNVVKPGNILELGKVPEGVDIFNIELYPGDGGRLVRASGTSARIINKADGKVTIKLPSKKEKVLSASCLATIGIAAGSGRKEKPFYKAGNKYYYRKAKNKLYPKVKGVAMNAVDHPHGGSRTSHKGRPTIAPKHASPGRKVGKLRPRRVGRRKR